MKPGKSNYLLTSFTILIIILQTTLCKPSCSFRNYCMGCHQQIQNVCTSCFNWGFNGIVKPRAFDGFSCAERLIPKREINNCKWYSGLQTNSNTALTINDCHICNMEFLNYTEGGDPICSSKSNTSECTKISDCMTTVCYLSSVIDAKFSTGCRMCSQGFIGDGNLTTYGSEKCIQDTASSKANCEYYKNETGYPCYLCKSGYAVENGQTACVSFTVDPNCRVLGQGNLDCE